MSKRINITGITLFFIFTLFSLGFCEESMTITTYYPSPYGSYNDLYVANRLGIGLTGPGAKLEVFGQAGSPARNMILSNNAAQDMNTRFIDCIRSGSDSEFIVYNDGNVRYDGTASSPADYAEYFYSNDTTLKPGELVCIAGDKKIKRCNKSDILIGVVSTKPGIVGIYADDITDAAEEYEKDPHWVKVGLLGH